MTKESSKLGEFARIARYFKPLSEGFSGAFALGDDAAAFGIPATHELVATTDAMTEGIHFLKSDSPQSIAQRLLRSNLSDLAAMGADPHAYLLVTALPQDISEDWLAKFAQALAEDQKRFGCHLIGGDSIRTQGPITLNLTALGLVPKGQLMRRKSRHEITAKNPCSIYVSGTIGDAALGLMLSQGRKFPQLTAEEENYLKQRHFCPEPRLGVSRAIRPFAKACIDISDGLVADIGHIAEQSSAQALLHAPEIPLSPAVRKLSRNAELFEALITGGEDYELAFLVDKAEESLLSIVASKVNVPLTKIGVLQAGTSGDVQVLDQQSHVIPLKQRGWTHF